jgi:hypothetical protein
MSKLAPFGVFSCSYCRANKCSMLGTSVVFGLAHSYRDWTGIIENSIDCALLGVLYVACGRNLIEGTAVREDR